MCRGGGGIVVRGLPDGPVGVARISTVTGTSVRSCRGGTVLNRPAVVCSLGVDWKPAGKPGSLSGVMSCLRGRPSR